MTFSTLKSIVVTRLYYAQKIETHFYKENKEKSFYKKYEFFMKKPAGVGKKVVLLQ